MPSPVEAMSALSAVARDCTLCPRACRVDRALRTGACRTGMRARITSAGPHFGEERVLVGRGGSGTIFLAGCNLACVFCQNSEISQFDAGVEMEPGELAAVALDLQERRCENVNFVSPTHVAHAVAEAVAVARRAGLRIPVVWNSGGYESVDTLRRLEGLIDIYMPDFKWGSAEAGLRYSGVPDYPAIAGQALAEMHRQVGPLVLDGRGIAIRGLLVRHLVMPGDLADSRRALRIVARRAPGAAVNVMGQYRPAFRALEYPELSGRLEPGIVARLRDLAAGLGLRQADP